MSRGHQRFTLLILAVAAVVGVVILALTREPLPVTKRMEGATHLNLLLDGPFGARFAGEMTAHKREYFPPNVTVRADPNDPDFVAAVARQHAVGVTSGHKFLLAAWRGVPVTAFAASFLDTSMAIFTLESSGLRRPADLVGKRVGYRRASEGEVIFDAMMAQLGLPRSQIAKVVDRDTFDALRAHEVEAIIAPIDDQPSPSLTGGDVRLNVIKPQDYGIHVPGLVYFVSNDLIHDQPSLIKDVLQSLIRGWHFVYTDYARSVPVLVGFDPERLNPDRVRFELQQQRDLILPTGGRIADYDQSRWRTLRDILIFAKLGEEVVPLAQLVNYQLLQDVYRRSLAKSGGVRGEN
ncbi:ABC transporter substrate-binding protein [Bradyrhizobium sp. BR 10261]|uniref:ABC transporter substrate-binding protein n=1 Tax=Bradyrhizobium sp. BR 10261 TaxID=2749992 RepID=UPI0028A15DC3|nr:ABC transporter substrate-binding protein [Bradyrhizobium sp. BR 10261]